MSIIISVHARQIFDSRGNPTVEVDVITENGILGRVNQLFAKKVHLVACGTWPTILPENITSTGELLIFCSALFGGGLGFLWYNAPRY